MDFLMKHQSIMLNEKAAVNYVKWKLQINPIYTYQRFIL